MYTTLDIIISKSTNTLVNIKRSKKVLKLLESRDNPVWLSIKLKSFIRKDADISITDVILIYRIFN